MTTERPLHIFDRAMLDARAALDIEIAASGAAGRVRSRTLSRLWPDPLADMPWRRIAAGVLIAGMLGAAFDLALPEEDAVPSEVALVDPLAGMDEAGL